MKRGALLTIAFMARQPVRVKRLQRAQHMRGWTRHATPPSSLEHPAAAVQLGRRGQHRHLALQRGWEADIRRARLHGQRAQVLGQPQVLQQFRFLRGDERMLKGDNCLGLTQESQPALQKN